MKHTILVLTVLLLALASTVVSVQADQLIAVKDSVIYCFPDGKDGILAHQQIEGEPLWVDAVRRDGKTQQVRVTSSVGSLGTNTPVKLYWPERADMTITWNMPVKRAGDIVSVMLPWNGVLIGDVMDVNEGAAAAEAARRELGLVSGVDSRLPVLYSSGDSISLGYWPFLEAELHDAVNVYYQQELAKDIPGVGLKNNGHAHLAYGVLEGAYKNPQFKPRYLLVNFGLHMIATHKTNVLEYGNWIEKFDDLAKQHHAQLIWVTTTPYLPSPAHPEAQNSVILEFNETARKIVEARRIPVIDLHAATLTIIKELGDKPTYADGVHFTDEAKKRQAAFIANRIREIIKSENKAKP